MMVSLVEAIHNKFNDLEDYECPEFIILGRSPGGKTGSHRPCIPPILIMECQNINTMGSVASLRDIASNIRELDLSGNHLTSWEEIQQLLGCVPHLQSLNLAHNPLHDSHVPLTLSKASFYPLSTLILNHTRVPWSGLMDLLPCFPRLQSLYVSGNHFGEDVQQHFVCCPSLTELYFNENDLHSWFNVAFLGVVFPSLSHLVLLNNCLGDVPQDRTDDLVPLLRSRFPHLQQLALSENPINNWATVEALNAFPQLRDLKLLNVTLFSTLDKSTSFSFIVAHLPLVERLNGSRITPKEREDAERTFIRHWMQQPEAEQPQRFHILSKKHGPVAPLVQISLAPPSSVYLKVSCFSSSGDALLNQPHGCSIALDITVAQMKDILFSQFAHILQCPSARHFRLFYVDQVMSQVTGREELKYLGRAFHSYQPEDGDELHLEVKAILSPRSTV